MQNRPRKILGMTNKQLIILACLGLVALVIMCIAVKMILGNLMSSAIPELQPTLGVQANTALPTRTPFPSPTPILPTPTFTATTYESLIPEGWKQLTYEKVELWVPADFENNSPSEALMDVTSKTPAKSGYTVNINLTNEVVTVSDLDAYVQEGLAQLPREVTYLERKKFAIGSYEAMRLKVEIIVMNLPIEEAMYMIKDGDTVWLISCSTHLEDFREWLPIFDQVARTFRISP
jgi:hypothetical protein